MSAQPPHPLRAEALREEALGAESGLGLFSGQDSGCIRGRLNLLGNGDNVGGDKLCPSLYELVHFTELSLN